VPVDQIRKFQDEYIAFLETKHKDILNALKAGKLDDSITSVLEAAAKELSAKYS